MNRSFLWLIRIMILMVLVSCNTTRYQETQTEPLQHNERLDKIELTDLNGNYFDLKNLRGKPVFLNFWATWCGPCIAEMKSIEKMYQTFKDDIHFLAVSDEDLNKIQSFQEAKSLNFEFARLNIDFIDAYVVKLPTTFLISKEGQLIYEEEGARDWTLFNNVEKIKALLQ